MQEKQETSTDSILQIQGARTIVFGTKNHLGRNFGVLIAWMVVGMVGVAAFTAMTLRQNQKRRQHVLR